MVDHAARAAELVRESFAAENARDTARCVALFAPEHVAYVNGDVLLRGADAEGPAYEAFAQALPDYRREAQWIGATDGWVVVQYRLTGTHRGELGGFAPSGVEVELHGVILATHDGEHLGDTHVFADFGELHRQLGGQQRPPATASATPSRPAPPERERASLEAMGERLVRSVYAAEAVKDIALWAGCYAEEFSDHYCGQAIRIRREDFAAATVEAWRANPTVRRTVEDVVSMGDRSAVRWHLTAEVEGEPVSQHGCTVMEHDGTYIQRSWAYYPDLLQVFPIVAHFVG